MAGSHQFLLQTLEALRENGMKDESAKIRAERRIIIRYEISSIKLQGHNTVLTSVNATFDALRKISRPLDCSATADIDDATMQSGNDGGSSFNISKMIFISDLICQKDIYIKIKIQEKFLIQESKIRLIFIQFM